MTVLLVVGGYPTSAYNDVEILDISGQGRSCRKADDYPGTTYGSSGAFFEDKAIICGGTGYTDECYNFDPTTGSWIRSYTLLQERRYARSTIINGKWWVTGGENNSGNLDETEVLRSNSSSFTLYYTLPARRRWHNLVNIDGNQVMLLSGQGDYYTDTYVFDDTLNTWTNGPELSEGRYSGQAGLVTFTNGTKFIVATGGDTERTTEILNLDDEDPQWFFGPSLPYYIYNGASVQYGNTFLIVGGDAPQGKLNTLWMYDMDIGNWTLLDQTLEIPRAYTTAFFVPDEYCIPV